MPSYGFIESPNHSYISLPKADRPLKVEATPNDWVDLKHAVCSYAQQLGSSYYAFDESVEYLTAGTINLINVILLRTAAGQPIQTIVFLDRSARNAEFLFQTAWRQVEELFRAQGHDTKDLVKPLIKFINIGTGEFIKQNDQLARSLIAKLFPPADLRGTVLVIDECFASGSTCMKAMQELDAAYHPREVIGLAQFANFPDWYRLDSVKGIGQPMYIDEDVRKRIGQLPKSEFFMACEIIRQLSVDEVNSLETRGVNLLRSKVRRKLLGQLQLAITDIDFFSSVKLVELVEYCKSAGGYLGVMPAPDQIEETDKYRGWLKHMMQLAFDRGWVKVV